MQVLTPEFKAEIKTKSDLQIELNKKSYFGLTVRNKQMKNVELVQSIDKYLLDNHQITLPEIKLNYQRILNEDCFDAETGEMLGISNLDYINDNDLAALINMRYSITTAKGYYAVFDTPTHHKIVSPMAFWYNKHRLCHVWNWRKSKIIRGKYYHFLKDAKDENGRKLTDHYNPIHLVLTVPHENGIFEGSEFYAKELIEKFTIMRKSAIWKKYVYSGEYGVEVKKSKNHGLHIHIHSFLLQHPEYSVNEAREEIAKLWAKIVRNRRSISSTAICNKNLAKLKYDFDTDSEILQLCTPKIYGWLDNTYLDLFQVVRSNPVYKNYIKNDGEIKISTKFIEDQKGEIIGENHKMLIPILDKNEKEFSKFTKKINKVWIDALNKTYEYSGIHYETLFTYQKDENGQTIFDEIGFTETDGSEVIVKKERYKDYIKPGDDLEKYLSGVMECIKYHFKPDALEKVKENGLKCYDIELIKTILNNTKNKRLYSRFGKFYNLKPLNFSNLEKEEEITAFEKTETDETAPNTETNVNGIEESLINPITLQTVQDRQEYRIGIINPVFVRYNFHNLEKPNENYLVSTDKVKFAPQSFSLKDTIKLDLQGFDVSTYNLDISEAANLENKLSKIADYENYKFKPTQKRLKLIDQYKALNLKTAIESESFINELIDLGIQRAKNEIEIAESKKVKLKPIVYDAGINEKWLKICDN